MGGSGVGGVGVSPPFKGLGVVEPLSPQPLISKPTRLS